MSAWDVITWISRWLLSVIERGYTLQFRRRPPHCNGMVQSLTLPRNAQVLRQEVCCLLKKGAVERVPPSELESGFYSCYFVVPKRDGGLRPILDLRPINRALCKRPFRMITLKQILAQIRPGDWFASVDLKDAYFHIRITPASQTLSEVCLRGHSIPILCSPVWALFQSAWMQHFPPEASRMRILNYLGDWLILAQSRDTLLSHIDTLLHHLESLGLCVNMQKSFLVPSQSITYLGVCFDSVEMRARLSQERLAAMLSSLCHFRLGSSVHVKTFQTLLGLMASPTAVCHLGLLHMRRLQLWLKSQVPWTAWTLARLSIVVSLFWSSEAVAQPRAHQPGSSPGLSDVTCRGNNGRINLWLGSSVRGHANFGAVVRTAEPMAHKQLGAGSSVLSSKEFSAAAGTAACPDSHRQHVCSVLY